jgi:hypothetical protein
LAIMSEVVSVYRKRDQLPARTEVEHPSVHS